MARTASAAESPGTIPRFRAAVALGLAGLGTDARELVERARQRYPESTLTRTVFIPTCEAAIAVGRGAPSEAIAALEAATPTEFGTVAGLVPTFLRGEAYLAKRDSEAARREFQKVLDHRGADPFAPVVPLARLGLARAWQMSGDLDKSRKEYDELLQIWKNADTDLPLLQRARAERAALTQLPLDDKVKESRIAQPAAQPGDVIAHYRLVERLGRDNDTTIYRAKDLTLDRDVAVKAAVAGARRQRDGAGAIPARGAHRVARHSPSHLRRSRFGRGERARVPGLRAARRTRRWTPCLQPAHWVPIACWIWRFSWSTASRPCTGAA